MYISVSGGVLVFNLPVEFMNLTRCGLSLSSSLLKESLNSAIFLLGKGYGVLKDSSEIACDSKDRLYVSSSIHWATMERHKEMTMYFGTCTPKA